MYIYKIFLFCKTTHKIIVIFLQKNYSQKYTDSCYFFCCVQFYDLDGVQSVEAEIKLIYSPLDMALDNIFNPTSM